VAASSAPGRQTRLYGDRPKITANGESPVLHRYTFRDSVTYWRRSCNPATFLGWVNALEAGGGADCPEASLSVAQQAVEKIGEGGELIVATDASPREGGETRKAIKKLAKSEKVEVDFIVSARCPPEPGAEPDPSSDNWDEVPPNWPAPAGEPADDTYRDIAAATGGMFIEPDSSADPTLCPDLLDLLIDSTAVDRRHLMLVDGTIGPPETEDVIIVPVDSTVQTVDFVLTSVTGGVPVFQVWRPDATPVAPISSSPARATTPGTPWTS
jgi:hypothetical protein